MMWITKISDFIKDKFNFVRAALPSIPPVLLICEAEQRPGLSAIALTTAIIQRLHEANIITGVNPDGTANKIGQFIRIFSEELVSEIQNNACVDMALNTGDVTITGNSVASFTATNLLPFSFRGVVR